MGPTSNGSTKQTLYWPHHHPMNATNLKCASPECKSAARDGHVCSYHYGTLYADRTFGARRYVVIATDPEREWMIRMFTDVRATSMEQAKAACRLELAIEKRDHWSLKVQRR